MTFTPSPQQAAAIRAIVEWYSNPNRTTQVFRLFGYAGSGKSTITRYVIEELGLEPMNRARRGCDPRPVHRLLDPDHHLRGGDGEVVRRAGGSLEEHVVPPLLRFELLRGESIERRGSFSPFTASDAVG